MLFCQVDFLYTRRLYLTNIENLWSNITKYIIHFIQSKIIYEMIGIVFFNFCREYLKTLDV